MFCGQCGNKLEEDAIFCPYCGTKVYENDECQTSTQSPPKIIRETIEAAVPLTGAYPFGNTVTMVVSIENIEGRSSKNKMAVLVDNQHIGEVLNGETATYKIVSGTHCIKIGTKLGMCSIFVNIPPGTAYINLNYKWGALLEVKPEIVCQQENFVTKVSEIDSDSERQIGLFCAILGVSCGLISLIWFFPLRKIYPEAAKKTLTGIVFGIIICLLINRIISVY